MRKGDRARFFDASRWGGQDVDDNDWFWMPATVVSVRISGSWELVDIQFDHRPERISKGHFTTFTKPIRDDVPPLLNAVCHEMAHGLGFGRNLRRDDHG